ncbi:hypothetical protein D3C77_327210 [compost metagenome]
MPADFLVELGAQAKGSGHSWSDDGGAGDGAPLLELWPDDHSLAGAEVLAVGHRFFFGLAPVGAQISEASQLLRDCNQGSGHRQRVEAWNTQDARSDVQSALGGEQGFHAGVLAGGSGGANEVTGGFGGILTF